MTTKQRDFLYHMLLHGPIDLRTFSGRVMNACARKGWVVADEDHPFPYGHTASETEWQLTDAGRLALHEATS
jgi:hypothetical protein